MKICHLIEADGRINETQCNVTKSGALVNPEIFVI